MHGSCRKPNSETYGGSEGICRWEGGALVKFTSSEKNGSSMSVSAAQNLNVVINVLGNDVEGKGASKIGVDRELLKNVDQQD